MVRPWPPESTRTRSKEPFKGFTPARGLPSPTLADAELSVRVLPVTAGSEGATACPVAGCFAALPNSEGLAALNGIASAIFCVPAILAAAASEIAEDGAGRAGPLTVDRPVDFAEEEALDFADFPPEEAFCSGVFFVGCWGVFFPADGLRVGISVFPIRIIGKKMVLFPHADGAHL